MSSNKDDEIISLWFHHPYFNLNENKYILNNILIFSYDTKNEIERKKLTQTNNLPKINKNNYLPQKISKKRLLVSIFLRLLCIFVLLYVILIMVYETNSWMPLFCLFFCFAIFFDLVRLIFYKKEYVGYVKKNASWFYK
jgi:hypothetical protein